MRRGRRPATIASAHPPAPFEGRAPFAPGAIAPDPLVDVAGHAANAERARAAIDLPCRFALVAQLAARRVDEIGLVEVARDRITVVPRGVGKHLLALAGKLPLGLQAQSLVLTLADRARLRPGRAPQRERLAGGNVLVSVHAESLVDALARANARCEPSAARELVGRWVLPRVALLANLGAVVAVDQHHALGARPGPAQGGSGVATRRKARRGQVLLRRIGVSGRGGRRGRCGCQPRSRWSLGASSVFRWL